MAAPRCQRSNGMAPSISSDIAAKLSEISSIFPRTKYICVVTNSGDLLASVTLEDQPPQDLLYSMSALQQAAKQFASTLDVHSCPVIHVSGESQMLSCYEAGPCIIAFYTDVNPLELDLLDVTEQDTKISHIIEELRLLVQNIIIHKSESR